MKSDLSANLAEERGVKQWVLPLLLLPPLFWAGNFIVGRAVRGEIPPLTLAFDRWVIASLLLLPFAFSAMKRDALKYWQHRWIILLTSVTGVTAFNSFIYVGLQTTTATNGLILNSFIPLLVTLFTFIVFHQSLRLKQWMAMAISFVGVMMIVTRASLDVLLNLNFNQGDLIVFCAMICWAIYTLGLKHMPRGMERLGLTTVQMIIGLVVLTPFYLMELATGASPIWNVHSILSLAYIGVVPSVLAYLLYSSAVAKLGPNKASMSIHMIPVFGVVLSILFLGESLHWYQISGMVLIFVGLFLS